MSLIARLLERRTHPANPDRWFIRWVGGDETDAGVAVDATSAMSSTAVLAAVRILAQSLATVPFGVYQADGRRREMRSTHPLHAVLNNDANAELTALELREIVVANAVLMGNGYAEIVRDGAGRVRELWPLWPHRVRPRRLTDGGLAYEVTLESGERVYLSPDNVLHLRGFSRGGLLGLDVIDAVRNAIGLTVAAEKYGSGFFARGMNPSGVLEHPGELGTTARKNLEDSWRGGLDQAHRVKILEEGMTFRALSVPPETAQFLETRQFQVVEVARAFGVPPHLLADLQRATFANIEHQGTEFVRYSLRPWAVRLEKRADRMLGATERAAGYYTHHNLDALMRGDLKSRYEAYAVGRQWGWLSANDVNALEDRNPIPDGDVYLVPTNMVPADMLEEFYGTPQDAPPAGDFGGRGTTGTPPLSIPPSTGEPVRYWLMPGTVTSTTTSTGTGTAVFRTEASRRSLDRRLDARTLVRPRLLQIGEGVLADELEALRGGLGRHMRDGQTFMQFVDDFYRDWPDRVAERFKPGLILLAELVRDAVATEAEGDSAQLDAAVRAFVDEYAATLGVRWSAGSRRQLQAIVDETDPRDLLEAIEGRLLEWSDTRADTNAAQESTRAESALTRHAYLALGVITMVWAAGAQSCPLCRAMNGRTVSTSGAFVSAGDVVDPDDGETAPLEVKGSISHPPLHGGCDCGITMG